MDTVFLGPWYFNEDPHVCFLPLGNSSLADENENNEQCIIWAQFGILLICHSYRKSGLGEYFDWSSTSCLMTQSNAAWMSDIMQQWVRCVQFRTSGVKECNHP